ncbi:hypothetical protein [Skermanella pratensis]
MRGEKKAEQEDRQQNCHVMERSYGNFARSVRLALRGRSRPGPCDLR